MTADFKGSFEQRGRVLLQELENLPGEGALYGFLIRQGNVLVPLAEECKTDVQLLQGCQYRVWLHLELKDGVVQIHADSDSLISRGLMALWIRLFSGLTPGEVMAADESLLHRSVLSAWLVPSRSNALENMASRIKLGVLKLRKGAWGGKGGEVFPERKGSLVFGKEEARPGERGGLFPADRT